MALEDGVCDVLDPSLSPWYRLFLPADRLEGQLGRPHPNPVRSQTSHAQACCRPLFTTANSLVWEEMEFNP